MIFFFLFIEMALVSLFRDSKGIIDYAKVIINLDLTNNKIITDILFLFLQLIESFPMSIVCYIRTIIVSDINFL